MSSALDIQSKINFAEMTDEVSSEPSQPVGGKRICVERNRCAEVDHPVTDSNVTLQTT